MRDILFRGKRKDNGEWVEGDLLTPADFMDVYEISENTGMGDRYDIDPETVGQFTGLTDKNGVKIFEGDVVRYNGKNHIVVFETRGGTGYFGIKIDHIETWEFCLSVPAKLMEVIGNIHDNHELLKSAKEENQCHSEITEKAKT